MQFSAGFLTVAACGLLAVVLPTLVASQLLWRKGGTGRVLVALGGAYVVAIVWLVFVGTDFPRQLEEALVISLLLWGFSFYALLALFVCGLALMRACGPIRR